MGYYSDIRIATTVDGYNMIRSNLGEVETATGMSQLMTEEREPQVADEYRNLTMIFGWNAIRWDEAIREIDLFMFSLAHLERAGIPYEYVRVGESSTDVEYREVGDCSQLSVHIEPVTSIRTFV